MTIPTWAESAARLIAVAAGRESAETVIRGGTVALVQTGEILPWQIAVAAGRIAYLGPDAAHCVGPDTEVVEWDGLVIPGLVDAHMHVESGMLTPAEFTRAVLPHGTTSMFVDPHEIANVLGLRGVQMMHDEAAMQPAGMYVQMPSCAPSAPGLETTGHEITPDDVAEAMTWPGIVGLGEMMNFPGVTAADPKMLAEMAATMAAGKTVGGHYASPDLGPAFHAYAAGGPADDHEGTREEDAVARARQGMAAMLRLGSAWYDVKAQITAVTERGLDPSLFVLCTDDCHSGTLVHDGHMDRVLRHAIECGCEPMGALRMATLNAARHFGMEREIGQIAPGRRADLVLTRTLEEMRAERVMAAGAWVAGGGVCEAVCPHLDWPAEVRSTVRLGRRLGAEDFALPAPEGAAEVTARVIGVVENQAPTEALTATLPVVDGHVGLTGDVAHIALVERHRGTGGVTNGFVSGFGYRGAMAMASTVAHDSHHMIVVGTDRDLMARAAMSLEGEGGVTVWKDGKEIARVALPIAGLMSDRPAAEVAEAAQGIVAAMEACGCTLNNAYMQHSLLALVVIPALRISDTGLIDVTRFERVEVLA